MVNYIFLGKPCSIVTLNEKCCTVCNKNFGDNFTYEELMMVMKLL